MAKKTSMKAYERSAADRKADKAGARKAGVSVKAWEGSRADRAADRKALRKINKKK